MNETEMADFERELLHLSPRGAPIQLRHSILDSVEQELNVRNTGRWFSPIERRCLQSVSMLLAFSVAVCVFVVKNEQLRCERLFPATALPTQLRNLSELIATQSGVDSTQWMSDYWRSAIEQRDAHSSINSCLVSILNIDSDLKDFIQGNGDAKQNLEVDETNGNLHDGADLRARPRRRDMVLASRC